MVPLVSEALAAIVILEPAITLLPLAGLVIETTGDDEAVVTVIVIGLDIVDTPLASMALAFRVKVPVEALVQLAVYGAVVAVANKYDPL